MKKNSTDGILLENGGEKRGKAPEFFPGFPAKSGRRAAGIHALDQWIQEFAANAVYTRLREWLHVGV